MHLFAGHDLKHEAIRLIHAVFPNLGKVLNAAIYILVDDALYGLYTAILHGHDGGENSGGDTGGDLQCTARLGTVANHASQVSNHVLYSKANPLVITAHQPGNTAAGARSGYYTAAESG